MNKNNVITKEDRDKFQDTCAPKKPHLQVKEALTEEGKKFFIAELSDSTVIDKDSIKKCEEASKLTVGTSDLTEAYIIIQHLAQGMPKVDGEGNEINKVSALLAALKPEDQTEALLLGQFITLQESGLRCLKRANTQDEFYHMERFYILATKLFNTANMTMQVLTKYRSKGQQTVQVVHLHNPNQTIVTQSLSGNNSRRGKEKSVIEPLG
ncbi:MAG: hypothetical protein JSS09_08125 [Verrucomicrobia bacterium]|nr:hypothetical protein [Verrucomicrobiota bacterium]